MTKKKGHEGLHSIPADYLPPPHLKTWQSTALAILSAVLLSFCYEPLNLNFLAWIAIVPFYIGLRGRKDKGVFWLGCLFGYAFSLISYYWLRSIMPGTPFAISFLWTPLYGLWAWMTRKMYFYLAFPCVTITIADARRSQFILSWQRLLILTLASSFMWTSFEWCRFWVYTGFPWNLLGISQVYVPAVLPVVSFFGVIGVSFIIIFSNMLIATLWEIRLLDKTAKLPWKLTAAGFTFIALVIGLCQMLKVVNKPDTSFRASLIQGCFFPQPRMLTQEEYIEYFRVYRELTLEQIANKPDFILWPETPLPTTFHSEYNQHYKNLVEEMTKMSGKPMLFGSGHSDNGERFNSAFYVDKDMNKLQRYDKIHIVPYGEYTPLKEFMPETWWKTLDKFINMGNLKRGDSYPVMTLNDKVHFGVNICYDDVFYDVSREYVRRGANLLVTLTNDSWYQQTCGGAQHMVHSTFRAVENGVPLLRCGTSGESCLVLPSGEVKHLIRNAQGNRITRGAITIDVPIASTITPTFYYKNPNLFVILCVGATFIAFLASALHFYKRKVRLRDELQK